MSNWTKVTRMADLGDGTLYDTYHPHQEGNVVYPQTETLLLLYNSYNNKLPYHARRNTQSSTGSRRLFSSSTARDHNVLPYAKMMTKKRYLSENLQMTYTKLGRSFV